MKISKMSKKTMKFTPLSFENVCPSIQVKFATDLPGQNYYQRILIDAE